MKFRNLIRLFGASLLAVCVTACFDDDYKPYKTDAAITAVTPRIRVFNIDFSQKSVSVHLGGKVYREGLVHGQITAYQETSPALLGDSVLEVYNDEQELLLRTKLILKQGSHYTITILPAYGRIRSSYRWDRWLFKTLLDSAAMALVPDPLQAPLGDRAAVRHVALAIDQAQYYSPYSSSELPNFGITLPDYPYPNHGLNNVDGADYYDNVFNLTKSEKLLLPLSSYPPSRDYDPLNPPTTQIGPYKNIQPRSAKVFSTGTYSGVGSWPVGSPPPLITPAVVFEPGVSYTILTNGTQGLTNDASRLSAENAAIDLEPIPYEVYILNDGVDQERIVTPQPQDELSSVATNLMLYHIHPNDFSVITLGLDGAVEKTNLQVSSGLPGVEIVPSHVTGAHTAEVMRTGSLYPVLASAPVNYRLGRYYMHYYYADEGQQPALKVQEIDTIFAPGKLRLNVLSFVPGLGPIDVVNARTGEVLITGATFAETSPYVELPILVDELPGNFDLSKSVDPLRIVRSGTDEWVADVNLSPEHPDGGTRLLYDIMKTSPSSMPVYTLLLQGDPTFVSRSVAALVRGTPQNTGDAGVVYYTSFSIAYIF